MSRVPHRMWLSPAAKASRATTGSSISLRLTLKPYFLKKTLSSLGAKPWLAATIGSQPIHTLIGNWTTFSFGVPRVGGDALDRGQLLRGDVVVLVDGGDALGVRGLDLAELVDVQPMSLAAAPLGGHEVPEVVGGPGRRRPGRTAMQDQLAECGRPDVPAAPWRRPPDGQAWGWQSDGTRPSLLGRSHVLGGRRRRAPRPRPPRRRHVDAVGRGELVERLRRPGPPAPPPSCSTSVVSIVEAATRARPAALSRRSFRYSSTRSRVSPEPPIDEIIPLAISCSSAWASSISVSESIRLRVSILAWASFTATSRDLTSFL